MALRPFLLLALLWVLPGPVPAQDRFFDSGGVRIRYVDRGAGPPVVLVHGFTGTVERSWIGTGVLPELARDHRSVGEKAADLRHRARQLPHQPVDVFLALGIAHGLFTAAREVCSRGR